MHAMRDSAFPRLRSRRGRRGTERRTGGHGEGGREGGRGKGSGRRMTRRGSILLPSTSVSDSDEWWAGFQRTLS